MERTADQVNPAASEPESTLLQLTQVAARQTTAFAQTLNAVERITQSIQAEAVNAQQATEIATLTATSNATEESAIDKTVKRLLKLQETVAHIVKKVQRLDASSQHISQVVSVIHQIALQTPLLSTNVPFQPTPHVEDSALLAITVDIDAAQITAHIQATTLTDLKDVKFEDAHRSIEQILDMSRTVDQLMQAIARATVCHVQTSQTVAQLMQAIALASEANPETAQTASGSLPPFSSPMNRWQNL